MNQVILHLMRHGAPQLPGLLLGHLDLPSEAHGVEQCVERARTLEFERVVTSDLSRARAPGAIIAAERKVEHHADARWRELYFGEWEGADPATLPPEPLGAFWDDPDRHPPPRGERWGELCGRVEDALRTLNAPTLVVTHAGAMRAALAALCGLDARQCWAVDLPYAAVLSLRVWPGPQMSGQMTALLP